MAKKLAPPSTKSEPLEKNGTLTHNWQRWFSDLYDYIRGISADSSNVGSGLSDHIGKTGTQVHGLGTASVMSSSAFDSAGSAQTVNGYLNDHRNQTVPVHGIGSIATHDAAEFVTQAELDDALGDIPSIDLAYVDAHIAGVGTEVHGLGTMSVEDASDYATVIDLNNVSTTLSSSISTTYSTLSSSISTTYSALSSSISTTYAASVHLQATTPGTEQTGHYHISGTSLTGAVDTGLVKINGMRTISRSASSTSIHIGDNGSNNTGTNNAFIGDYSCGYDGTGASGVYNVGLGTGVMRVLKSGSYNVGLSPYSFYSLTDGASNFAGGYFTLGRLTTGISNVSIGHNSGAYITGGKDNVVIGALGFGECNGSYNTVVGKSASQIDSAVSVDRLLAFGFKAGYRSYGSGNVFIGCETGSQNLLTNINNCIFIGTYAGVFETNSDRLIIDNAYRGNQTVQQENALIYGSFTGFYSSSQSMRINGNTGIRRNPSSTAIFSLPSSDTRVPFQIAGGSTVASPVEGSLEYNDEFYMTYDNGHGATRHRIDTKEKPCTVISSTYTMDGTERVVVGISTSAPLTVFLPEATGSHLIYKFKNMGTQTMTLEASALPTADLIDASASKMVEQYQAYELLDCSTNQWLILSYYNNGASTTTVGNLLLETGDGLLLETGDALQLEGGSGGGDTMATILQDTYEEV